MAAHGMSVVELERVGRHRAVAAGRPGPAAVQPAGHRADHEVRADRPGRRLGLARDRRRPDGPHGRRHAEQLRRRRDPVGHRALRRGELQPVLRRRRRRAAELKPKLDRYGITTAARYPSGSRKWERVDERFDLAQAPATRRTASAGSSRSTRSTRTPPRASTPRWAASSTRAPTSSWRDGRPRRRVHGRRRALRLPLQVRLGQEVHAGQLLGGPRAQPDPAGVGHALRRAARPATSPPPRSTAPASCPPTARSTAAVAWISWSAATARTSTA